MGCAFCEGKRVKMDTIGPGIRTMQTNLYSLFGYEGSKGIGGIRLVDKNKLAYDNSSGEYAEQLININYCPFCGKILKNESLQIACTKE